jgi:hypothetical protein
LDRAFRAGFPRCRPGQIDLLEHGKMRSIATRARLAAAQDNRLPLSIFSFPFIGIWVRKGIHE